jgi:periplasmic divalent cation tolerance protein
MIGRLAPISRPRDQIMAARSLGRYAFPFVLETIVKPRALLVLTTCATSEEAAGLATALVEQRLAACVNSVEGVASTYRWRDSVQRERECLLIIKTTEARYAALEAAIRSRTSYELPEVLAVRVDTGLPDYLGWLEAGVTDEA